MGCSGKELTEHCFQNPLYAWPRHYSMLSFHAFLFGAPLVVQRAKCLPAMQRPGFDPWVRKIPWRRKWQPTPVFLPGESCGQRSLVGYSPCGRKESGMTEWLHFHFSVSLSCLQMEHHQDYLLSPSLLLFCPSTPISLSSLNCILHLFIHLYLLKYRQIFIVWLWHDPLFLRQEVPNLIE